MPSAIKTSLVIIPTYNEAANIEAIILETWQHAPATHVLVIDDNSKDGTADIVRRLQQQHSQGLHLLTRAGKLGLGTAYIMGFKWALARNYDAIIEMDADFSHSPSVIPTMLRELGEHPVVIGSRYIEGGGTENWNAFRKLISLFGSFYARTILGMTTRDLTGGFNAWRREVLAAIDPDRVKSEGYAFQIELKYRAQCLRYPLREIPILFSERRAGQSKMSGKIVLEAMGRVWDLRRDVPRLG